MLYPAILKPAEEGGFVVSFRDIPEAITQGETLEDALDMAADALICAMEFYFEDRRAVPPPSLAEDGEHLIELPVSVSAKVLLLNEMLNQRITNAELARRIGLKPQEMQRVVNLSHTTKIDTIHAAMRAMGKRLDVIAT